MLTIGIQSTGYCFQNKWPEFVEKHGARARMLDLLAPHWMEQVRDCDAVMWHWWHDPDHKQSARTILHVIETELGIPVFPSYNASWHFDDKIAQAFMIEARGLPMPKTWVFWRREDAVAWARTASYPVVFKLSAGAGSSNVSLVADEREARRKIRLMFSNPGYVRPYKAPPGVSLFGRLSREAWHLFRRALAVPGFVFAKKYPYMDRVFWEPQRNYALFQEFVAGNEGDTRITVIGERAFGFRRRNRPEDFRASGSGLIDHDVSGVDLRCVRLAFDAADKLGIGQSAAFDFLLAGSERTPVISEFSYGYADWAVERCPGHWDRDLNWHEGHMWPQEAHVMDMLTQVKSAQNRGRSPVGDRARSSGQKEQGTTWPTKS